MNFKYNEKLYGEKIYNEGFQTNYTKSELVILVKYLKEVKELKRKESEEFLYDFCKKYLEGFNEVNYFKVIDGALVKGRKKNNKLIVIENIPIYKEEIEYIDSLTVEHEYKKLLLAFLASKKISLKMRNINSEIEINEMSAYFEGDKKRYSNIFKTANIVGKYNINEMIHDLVSKGLINSIVNGGIILEYLYLIYKTREETIEVINRETGEKEDKIKKYIIYDVKEYELYDEIKDFENIGYVFDYYKGENKIIKCENCGKFMKQSINNKKYCPTCAKEIWKEQVKINMREYRKRKKND